MWFALVLAGLAVRPDLLGVTSLVRALCFREEFYHSLLHFFHSRAVKLDALSQLWFSLIIKLFPVCRVDGRIVIILDGIKIPKQGRKMPGVKLLHQSSESNAKPEYVMAHSFQVFGVLCEVNGYSFCVPVCGRIHEGVVLSNRDRKTLIDKAAGLLECVTGNHQFLLIADAYYANAKMIRKLTAQGALLVSRVRNNAVGYEPVPKLSGKRGRGRPRKYGRRVALKNLFSDGSFETMKSPVYGEKGVCIRYCVKDLLWKPVGRMVRFILVDHPRRGRMILLATDLELEAGEAILQYGLRFKIEVSFKQAIHTVGIFGYHFWMARMQPLKPRNGNQYLHRQTAQYRRDVLRKVQAYHVFVQTGLIAQGLLQYLSMTQSKAVWNHFGSWIRTIRPGVLPSEMIVAAALKNTLPEFLASNSNDDALQKFIMDKVDLSRASNIGLAA